MDIRNIDCAEEAPIFIGGPKRSGSTLLRRIVNSHSRITMPSPEWLFHFVYIHLYGYGDLGQDANLLALVSDCLEVPLVKKYWNISQSPREILALLPERSFRGVYTALFRLYMADAPTPLWGAKTPSNVFWARELQAMYPKARFLLLHRDGRDVSIDQVASAWGPNNLYNACMLWRQYTEAMLRARHCLAPGSFLELRYEDLVRRPEAKVREICAFLGLEYEPAMLAFHAKGADPFFSQAHHLKADKPVTDEYVGLYKALPEADRRLQTAVLGDLLRELGYEVEDEPRDIGPNERAWYVEEDEHGALILDGEGVAYMNRARAERQARKERGVWSDADRLRQYVGA